MTETPTTTAYAPSGVTMRDLGCIKSIQVMGVDTPIPPPSASALDREPVLFVTSRPTQCFLDETIGYGSFHSSQMRLTGQRAYWLPSTVSFWFTPPGSSVDVNQGATGATRDALNECP